MTLYIANAFSLSMLPPENKKNIVKIMEIGLEHFKFMVNAAKNAILEDVECAIGHASTAQLVEELTNTKLECKRKQITISEEDTLLVIQLMIRLEEGKVLDYNEIRELYEQGKIKFYLVELC